VIDTSTSISTAIACRQGELVVRRTQDTTPILEHNKRVRNDFQSRRGENLRYVAEIPNIVIEQWMKEGINIFDKNDAKKVQAKLNSNEYAYLRTSTGKMRMKV
jgi:hypothetical protein